MPIGGTYDLGPRPKRNETERQKSYILSTCFACASCMEACPNFNEDSPFICLAATNQAQLHNSQPTGEMHKEERFDPLLGKGGIAYCGNDLLRERLP